MHIKKLLIIIIASLALLSPLYARGVTESVARDGVKGVHTYLQDLGKAEKDERIPEAKREEIVEKVYSGMTFEEAAREYIKEDESISPSTQTSLPVKAEEGEKVSLETAAPVAVEETESAVTPQTEEEKIPQKVEEEKSEEKTEETAASEAEETSAQAAEESVYSDTLSYKGLTTTITVGNTMATLTVPAGIGKDDIEAVAYIVSSAYPEEASLVTYSVKSGVLTLYYPEQTDEFLLSIMSTLREGGMYLIDLYKDAGSAPLERAEDVKDDTAYALSIASVDKAPVYAGTLAYKGVTSEILVDTTYATFTIPRGMDGEDIQAVAELVAYLYPREASLITYTVDGDTLTLTYPEQTGEFLLSALTVLREEAMALIDAIEADEVKMAEAPQVVKGAVYEDTLYYKNVSSKIAVYSTYATLTLPEGMTEADVKAVADLIASEYRAEAALVTYTLEGDTLTLNYPEQTDAFLLGAVNALRAEAVAFIDFLEKTVVKAEAAVETAVSAAETVASPALETTDSAVEQEVSAETVPALTSDAVVSTPSAELEKKTNGVFSYDITLGLKGKFVYYKGSDHIYPTLSFSMRKSFYEKFFLEAEADVFSYILEDKLYAVGGVNLYAGYIVPVSSFDIYFRIGLRYQLASKTSSFKSGMSFVLGAGLDWKITEQVIAGAGYEYSNSTSHFRVYAKYRF